MKAFKHQTSGVGSDCSTNKPEPILGISLSTACNFRNTVQTQGTLRNVLQQSIGLVIVITLDLLTSCHGAQYGLTKLWHHVWSALLLSPTPLLCLHLFKCDTFLCLLWCKPVWILAALTTVMSLLMLRWSLNKVTTLAFKDSLVSGFFIVIPYKIKLFFLFCSNSYIFS